MVTEWVINVFESLWAWLWGVLPAPDVPSWFDSAEAGITQIGGMIGWLDPWAPIPLLLTILGVVIASWLIANAIRLARILLSYLSFGGGAV